MKRHLWLLLFLFLSSLCLNAQVASDKRITVKFKNEQLTTVFKQLGKLSGYKILYVSDDVKLMTYTGTIKNKNIREALDIVLSGKNLEYTIDKEFITIANRRASTTRQSGAHNVLGRVIDSQGEPLIGATIRTNDSSISGVSDKNGSFNIPIPSNKSVTELHISYLGMKDASVKYAGRAVTVTMEDDVNTTDEVVVNGIFERRKESFTGAATVIGKEELMRSGSKNLLYNLKNLDPSFKIVENMDMGSDPNTMPEIQMRGQQSMPDLKGTYNGNPNQPLFILDGFETDITTVFDLDMNRVETVVLLKDAAAKAIYGSKAANGVVVIETRKPEPGRLKITYKGDLNLTIPDLTGYNLCNAREKYEVDKLYGTYSDPWFWEQYLNKNLSEIERGVDTDWLAQPLRTGVGNRHSVYLEGGDDRLRYGVDLLYNDVRGVMKGSDRKTFTGGFTLSYRYENLLVRNQFNVSLNHADDSPYGSFSTFASLNPYWSPYDENGEIKQIAGSTGGGGLIGTTVGNPLWDAQIGTKLFSKYTTLTNNFYLEWQLLKSLKLTGRLGLTKTQNGNENFYPAQHSMFLNYSDDRFYEKGLYQKTDGQSSSISADVTANYSLVADKHTLFFNAGWSMQESRSESSTFSVVGFPNNRITFITSGLGTDDTYYPPSGYESISRELGLLSALNYSYDDRYLADLSYRANASSRFGKDKRWGQFWSAGIGWNVHKEHFMKDVHWLRQLKLRASTGYTGSQNFSPYQSLATFSYYQKQAYDNWIGSYLMALPNDDLKWQRTKDYNAGFDLNVFGRLTVRYDYYVQNTEDQLLSLTIPPSMGFTSYMENLGSTQNKGMELKLNANVIMDHKKDRYLSLFFSIAKNTNKLKKISNALKAYNDEVDNDIANGNTNKPQTHYIEGESMNAIWAVRSLGIDPATGDEIYLTKDGEMTTEWRTQDQVVCGDAMPKCTGSFGLNMDYSGIFLNLSFYYQFGGQTYNQTLVDRVENANIGLNVDKRIYNSVWREPGDEVNFSYKAYKTTKPSSRFVQDLNELSLSSLNVGYDFKHCQFIKRWKLEQLKVSFYMNDVFRASTVKTERGLTYPFARTYSISLQATF